MFSSHSKITERRSGPWSSFLYVLSSIFAIDIKPTRQSVQTLKKLESSSLMYWFLNHSSHILILSMCSRTNSKYHLFLFFFYFVLILTYSPHWMQSEVLFSISKQPKYEFLIHVDGCVTNLLMECSFIFGRNCWIFFSFFLFFHVFVSSQSVSELHRPDRVSLHVALLLSAHLLWRDAHHRQRHHSQWDGCDGQDCWQGVNKTSRCLVTFLFVVLCLFFI